MKVVLAIDSFKGCITSVEANQAAAEGVRCLHPDAEIVQVAVSDGGEGFLEAYRSAVGGEIVELTVNDPLMRPVIAKYLLNDVTAVIETAQAIGLTLLTEEERKPMVATSYGTGQLIADAVRRGAQHIIVGLGGSATSDAGIGMLRALIDSFARHGCWDDIKNLKHVRFTIASDVNNPLCGENGAAHVFAPQKGATTQEVVLLDERARLFAEVSARHFGYDCQTKEGAGAAGGLGYALMQYLNAEYRSGIDLLLDAIKFDDMVSDADLIITGEGTVDRQTLMGKLPMGILRHASAYGHRPILLAGRVLDKEELLHVGFADVVCINPSDTSIEEAMQKTVAKRNICRSVSRVLAVHELGGSLSR